VPGPTDRRTMAIKPSSIDKPPRTQRGNALGLDCCSGDRDNRSGGCRPCSRGSGAQPGWLFLQQDAGTVRSPRKVRSPRRHRTGTKPALSPRRVFLFANLETRRCIWRAAAGTDQPFCPGLPRTRARACAGRSRLARRSPGTSLPGWRRVRRLPLGCWKASRPARARSGRACPERRSGRAGGSVPGGSRSPRRADRRLRSCGRAARGRY